jgi:hypothetical protein
MTRIMMLAVIITLLTACASRPAPLAPRELSVSEVPASGSAEPLVVNGWIVARQGQPVRLCQAPTVSFPPQCGGSSLVVDGLDLAQRNTLESIGGVTWGQAKLRGRVSGGVLKVEPNGVAYPPYTTSWDLIPTAPATGT